MRKSDPVNWDECLRRSKRASNFLSAILGALSLQSTHPCFSMEMANPCEQPNARKSSDLSPIPKSSNLG